MRAVFAMFLLGMGLRAQQGSIAGITINSETKEPVAGVHVRLVNVSQGRTVGGTYGGVSDREGHFTIATIRPGMYFLAPERTGYLYLQSQQSPNVVVKPGQQVTDMRLEMEPRAVLAGRVVDENGDPVQGAVVSAMAVSDKDEPSFIAQRPNPSTDDRGEFRVMTTSGRYYLQARYLGETGMNELPEIRSDGPVAPYIATFYPSTPLKSRATPVAAVGGKEVGGLEIRLSRQKGLSISGIVSGIPEGEKWASVFFSWGKTPQEISGSMSVRVNANGRYTVQDVEAAYYRLTAAYDGRLASRPVDVQVDSSDILNVDLVLVAGGELAGAVEVEGEPPGAVSAKSTVRLEPTGSGGFSPLRGAGGDLDAKGEFRLTNVGAGIFRLRVEPMPENGFIRKVELDGTVLADNTIDLSAGMRTSRVKVTLSRKGAQVAGRVLDENGDRLTNPLVMVMMMPVAGPKDLRPDTVTRPEEDGRYSLKGVAPGKYRIVAFDVSSVGSGTAAILKMGDKGEEIEIAEGAKVTKDVRVSAKEGADAKPKQ